MKHAPKMGRSKIATDEEKALDVPITMFKKISFTSSFLNVIIIYKEECAALSKLKNTKLTVNNNNKIYICSTEYRIHKINRTIR